jgi:rhamnosyl/mannosyltransferase
MESHLATLCNEIRESVDLRVLVAGGRHSGTLESYDGVTVQRLRTWFSLAGTPFYPDLAAAIRYARPDVLHVHLPNPVAAAACLGSGYRGPLVVTYHSDVVRQRLLNHIYNPLVHRLLDRCSGIIVSSPNYLFSSPVLGRHADRCRIIPLGIRSEEFSAPDPPAAGHEWERRSPRIILGVGRLVYYKGFECLVRAMESVDARLVLVGDGPLRKPLERIAAGLGILHKVEFAGNVSHSELVALYHAAAIFVLPSVARSEAFGIVQLEAMAAGKPVINTSLQSGVPFVSRHEETGLTVAPGHAMAMATAINRLLGDPAACSAFGAAARARVQRLFHVRQMAQKTLQLYEAVTGQPVPYVKREAVNSDRGIDVEAGLCTRC